MKAHEAMRHRDAALAGLLEAADDLLVGRTITGAGTFGHRPDCDSPNGLLLTLDDGSSVRIVGGYNGYSGHSCDEYVEILEIKRGVA